MRGLRGYGAALVGCGVLVAGLVGGCGSEEDDGDVAAFCEAVADLQDEDPFEGLDIASPGEMRSAFDRLDEGVGRIAETAPSEARPQAEAYQDSVDDVIDQLSGAGFDPRNLDPLAYREATDAYADAAVSVDNTARNLCP